MNKRIGTDFERRVCGILSEHGYWVHFIAPDARGAQPFDIVAVKSGKAFAMDCKTCVADRITIRRLEDNQVMAFEKWINCGNDEPLIIVEHKGEMFEIQYSKLKKERSVKISESKKFYPGLWI